MRYDTRLGHSRETIIAVIRERFKGKSLHATKRNHAGKSFCAYRGVNGTACAVGLYIPDGHPALQELGCAVDVLSRHKDLQAYMPFDNAEAISEFQAAHDNLVDSWSVSEQRDALIQWVRDNVT